MSHRDIQLAFKVEWYVDSGRHVEYFAADQKAEAQSLVLSLQSKGHKVKVERINETED